LRVSARNPQQQHIDLSVQVEARSNRPRDERVDAMVRLGAPSGLCRLCGHLFLRLDRSEKDESCSDECQVLLQNEPNRFIDEA